MTIGGTMKTDEAKPKAGESLPEANGGPPIDRADEEGRPEGADLEELARLLEAAFPGLSEIRLVRRPGQSASMANKAVALRVGKRTGIPSAPRKSNPPTSRTCRFTLLDAMQSFPLTDMHFTHFLRRRARQFCAGVACSG